MAGEINFGLLGPGIDVSGAVDSYVNTLQRNTDNKIKQVQLARQTRLDARDDKKDAAVSAAAPLLASGDYAGAGNAALAGGNAELFTQIQGLSKAHREEVAAHADAIGGVAVSLKALPPDQRPAAFAQARPALIARGVTPDELNVTDFSDSALDGHIASTMTVKDALAKVDGDRKFDLQKDQFGETTRHNTVTEGLTARQIARQASDAAAGRAVTMRGQNMTDARMKAIQAGSALTPDDVQFYAEQVAAGDTSPLTNFGRGTQGAANVVAIRNAAANIQRGRGLTGADAAATSLAYGGQKAAARTTGNMGAKIDYGVNELAASIPLAAQASAALPRGSFVPLNKVKQMIAAGNGDPALKDFAVKSQAALNAYNMVAARGGSSVGEREHNATLLMTADSPAAYQAALNAMAQEGAVAKGASHQTMNDVTGRRAPRTTEHAGGTLTRAGGGVLEWKPNGGR